jgi:hypothetical protein
MIYPYPIRETGTEREASVVGKQQSQRDPDGVEKMEKKGFQRLYCRAKGHPPEALISQELTKGSRDVIKIGQSWRALPRQKRP